MRAPQGVPARYYADVRCRAVMRLLGLLTVACFLAIAFTPAAAADVAVRTCNSPTSSCDDQVFVRSGLVDCNLDYIKGGLGKPGTVRVDCIPNIISS